MFRSLSAVTFSHVHHEETALCLDMYLFVFFLAVMLTRGAHSLLRKLIRPLILFLSRKYSVLDSLFTSFVTYSG